MFGKRDLRGGVTNEILEAFCLQQTWKKEEGMRRVADRFRKIFALATAGLVLALAGPGYGQPVQEAKLTAADGTTNDGFGHVSISGNRVVSGANGDDNLTGSAYVFSWDGAQWVQETKLTADDGAPDSQFGNSTSISGDRIVSGASHDDAMGTDSGSAYVFAWNGSQWVQQAKLTPSDGGGDNYFGWAVDIDGNRIAVGASHNDSNGSNSGAAYVFAWNGSQWIEEAKLTAADGASGDQLGVSVGLDGNYVVAGANWDDDSGSKSGSAYLFAWDGSQWVQEAKLTASDGATDDNFGVYAVLDGSRAVAGAYGKNASTGAAYVFNLSPALSVWAPDVTTPYDADLTVPVYIDDTTGKNIVSAELFLAYDGDILTAVSAAATGTLLIGDWAIETNIVEGIATNIDTIKMAMATDEDALTGAGTLIHVNFQVADIRHPASSPLTLTHVLLNDGDPENAPTDGSVTLVGIDGVITSLPAEILPRWSIGVSVYDIDEDRDIGTRDAFAVAVTNDTQTETLMMTETGPSTGVFSGVIGTVFSLAPTSGDGIVQAKAGDQVVFTYADSLDADGETEDRTDATDVIGGTDGLIRTTVVSQPGDTVRVRVSDADLSDAVAVSVANPRTGETESILLSQFTSGESHFYGRFFTGTQAGAVGDSTLEVAKGDTLTITYGDTLTANGGTAAVGDDDEVVDPFGDAHPNGSVQAFDAAQVLIHRLSTYGGGAGTLSGLDSLSANGDQSAPFGIIDGYDASLVLRKVVGLIDRFEVQAPDAVNHPQSETAARPKPVPRERRLALIPGEGYVSVWCADRSEIVSGELTLAGVQGQVVMGEELPAFLSMSRETRDGVRIVFAGAQSVSGPGELLRIRGVGPEGAQLTRASFNGGRIDGRIESTEPTGVSPRHFALHANAPNPFNSETSIRFELAEESAVRLEVFDLLGQRVRVLVAEALSAGEHQVLWDGRDELGARVSSGVYIYRLRAGGDFRQQRRMLLLK